MTSATPLAPPKIEYPEDNGEPMAENTLQFRWIVTIQGGLDAMFANNPNVFVAGDLLWYPVEGDNAIRQAPDVMVVTGRPNGDRGSYRQWEEGGVPPQVVFEVLSPGNRPGEMIRKSIYEHYGVEEYYLYDPDRNELEGYVRSNDRFDEIPDMNGWVSPRLGVRFDMSGDDLCILRPDGRPLVPYVELAQAADQERERAERLAARLRAAGIDPETDG
jgi:Uma2 family endonuclease